MLIFFVFYYKNSIHICIQYSMYCMQIWIVGTATLFLLQLDFDSLTAPSGSRKELLQYFSFYIEVFKGFQKFDEGRYWEMMQLFPI